MIDYNHKDKAEILQGFKYGFKLHYSGPRGPTESNNLKSAKHRPDVVRQKIKKELDANRVGGPYKVRPIPNLRISPIGLVEKKNSNDFRLIHHLSYPHGGSVNDFIDPALTSVQYTSFDEAVHMIQDFGKGCMLGKSDIKSAFRLLPVDPMDFELLGFKFEDHYYVDKCMPFGCAISCSSFEKFGRFLEFYVKGHIEIGNLLHYLDDFLFAAENQIGCQHIMDRFLECTSVLGVPVAKEKTEGPKTVIIFLGLELDSDQMVIRIPAVKVLEIVEKIKAVLAKEKVTLKIMQSLIGSLQFACKAIVPGRPFCRRLIDSICGLTKPHHHLRINQGIRQDLAIWLQFFQDFNGVSVFNDRVWLSNEDLQLFTDSAAGDGLGFGIYFDGNWTYSTWPAQWREREITSDITVLEFFPLLVSLYIWGELLRNKKILFRCDNSAVVHIINTRTSKSKMVMILLRDFTLKCLNLNIAFKASHIAGTSNVLTDALSRLQIEKFHRLAPGAEPDPEPIPYHLWNILGNNLQSS